jgi:hypothetical protein
MSAAAQARCATRKVILRRTPGASLFQSRIAALPVRSVSVRSAAPTGAAMLKAAAMKSAGEKAQTVQRFSIHVSNRFETKYRVDRGSARASRVGFGVAPKQSFAIAHHSRMGRTEKSP